MNRARPTIPRARCQIPGEAPVLGVSVFDATVVYSNYASNQLLGGERQDFFYGIPDYDQHDWDQLTETFMSVG